MDITERRTIPICVNNPVRVPSWTLPAERIPIGPGYKPVVELMPDGTLLMVALFGEKNLPGNKVREWTGIFRSEDGGKTWSERQEIQDMIGREQFLSRTRDGVLFCSSHLLPQDVNNEDGYTTSWLHRSVDKGKTWERTRATVDGDLRCGIPPQGGSNVSRNVVELDDGTLLFGVAVGDSSVAYMWRSADAGKTWDKTQKVSIRGYYDNLDPFFAEDYTYLTDSGRLLHWCRVGHPSPMTPMADGRVCPSGNDHCDRMMWTSSDDLGLTWDQVTDFGDYGQHYPRVLKLRDGRLLMTFTQRGMTYPLGLRGMISYDDGENWEFDADQLVIEGFSPWGGDSGGGFGNTVQLTDGTLVSCYSYTEASREPYIEVVRWELP